MKNYFARLGTGPLGLKELSHIAWAFVLPAMFFSSQLFAPNPHFNFFADLYNLYFPQFVEGYHLANAGNQVGIDFLTSNGASPYFLRPNIPAFYPVYRLAYFLFSFDTIEGLARAFVVILYLHAVVALYFCMKAGREFFKLDGAAGLLFGVLYFGAIARAYPIPPFYFIAALFPAMLYFALKATAETAWWRLVLYSFPFFLGFLSGYLPLDVNAALLAYVFALIYVWQGQPESGKAFFRGAVKAAIPIGLAGIVVLPIYLAILHYQEHVRGLPGGVWHAAHELSYEPREIFALMSRGFLPRVPGNEWPSVILGLPAVLMLILAFAQRKKLSLMPPEAKLVSASLFVFAFYLLLALGRNSGLPDLFYFLVPGIGKMHFYGRYLLVASFFFFLAAAIAFKQLVQLRMELPVGRWLSGLLLVLVAVYAYAQFSPVSSINSSFLVVELLMCGAVLLALSSRNSLHAYVAAIGVSFFILAAGFNAYTNVFNDSALPPYKNTVAFSDVRRDALRNYFKKHSDKTLIKFADLTSSIEKHNSVMLNYPWMVQDTVKLSNYMGYELHTSVDVDYLARFPWFGKVSVPWLLRTGADFVIYDAAALAVHGGELGPWIDREVPEHDVGFGFKAAKLKDPSGRIESVPARNPGDFDNGIVRVMSPTGATAVLGFTTDFASHIRFQVDGTAAATVRYLLFPNKMMELVVDGKHTEVTLKDGLLEFSLPAGRHEVEYRYNNRLHSVFILGAQSYLILLLGILGWRAWVAGRKHLAQPDTGKRA